MEKRDNNEKKGEGISYPFPRKKNKGEGRSDMWMKRGRGTKTTD